MSYFAGKSLTTFAAAMAALSLTVSGVLLTSSPTALAPDVKSAAAGVDRAAKQALAEAFGKLPLAFEVNRGQTDGRVDYLARGPGYLAFLSSTETVFKLTGHGEGSRPAALRMKLVGANSSSPAAASNKLPGTVNYFGAGSSPSSRGVATYGRVNYREILPGIDMAYYGNQRQIEYDFIVAPGADPGMIKIDFHGADGLKLAANGDLMIEAGGQSLVQRRPVVYQTKAGKREAVQSSFVLEGNRVGFEIGDYDRSKRLIIDPVIAYRSYLGSAGVDIGFGVAVDSAGAAYITGSTSSTNFPTFGTVLCSGGVTTSSLQCDPGLGDGFVTKMNPGGGSLAWSTYLGGAGEDQGWDVGVDAAGNVYVAGSTESVDFPTTANALDATCGTDGTCNAPASDAPGLSDSFLSKLDPTGSTLLYSSYLGGSDVDLDTNPAAGALGDMDIAVKGTVAYITAATGSADFPTTPTGDQQCGTAGAVVGCNLHNDAYLTLLDTAKSGAASLVFSTYLGGDGDDQGKGVAVDSKGNAYVAGITFGFPENPVDPASKPTNNFPSLSTAGVKLTGQLKASDGASLQPAYGGGASDGFVAKFVTSGLAADASLKLKNLHAQASAGAGSLAYATYLGGGGADEAWDVDVLGDKAYVVGYTESGDDPGTPAPDGPAPYFPTTKGAFDRTYNGRPYAPDGSTAFLAGDAFVAKLKAAGEGLEYSTFFGGNSGDVGMGIDVDSAGNAYITGYTHCEAPVEHIGPIISSIQIGFPTGNGTTRNGSVLDATYPVHARTTGSSVGSSTPDDLPAGTLVTFTATPDPITGAVVKFPGGVDSVTVAVDGLGQATTSVTPDPANPVNPATGGIARIKAELASNPGVFATGLANWGFPKPSCTSDFPTTAGAPQPVMNGDYLGPELHNSPAEGFVAKLDPSGSGLGYSTFLGGNDFDRGYAIAVREAAGGNEAYITGRTGSTGVGTAGSAFSTKPAGKGNRDSYIAKISEP